MKSMLAANWKMHKTRAEARETAIALAKAVASLPEDREVVVFAPYTVLDVCAEAFKGGSVGLGGQNVYPADHGAFTGEISPAMLRDCGCAHVLTGHSERRALMGEDSVLVGEKTAFALERGLKVTMCIGETLEQREDGQLESVLAEQITLGLALVADTVSPEMLAIAYEPVWAIGTGKVAGPREILEAHAFVRRLLVQRFPKQGHAIRILYGGSVKPENAGETLALEHVNGVLVGGASLDAQSMAHIALA